MTAYNLGNWLNIASFYMVAGCGAAISMKSGEFNLGGEGQIYAGGFGAAIVLAKMAGSPAGLAVPLAILAACLTPAILCYHRVGDMSVDIVVISAILYYMTIPLYGFIHIY